MPCALAGGDDYELCITARQDARPVIEAIAAKSGVALTRIGKMQPGNAQVTVIDEYGVPVSVGDAGFDHFAARSK